MKKSTIGTAGVAVAIITALALTGCTAATNAKTSTHRSTVSPAHPAKPAINIAELKAGDAVDDSTAAAINSKGGDTHAYKLPNGTYIVVKKDSPLPAAVQANVNAVANAGANTNAVNSDGVNTDAAHGVQETIEFSTGKNVAVIQQGIVSTYSGTQFVGYEGIASFYNGSNPVPVSTSDATIRADLQAEIAKQSDPASWIIVENN
jgi:hypothetical protein